MLNKNPTSLSVWAKLKTQADSIQGLQITDLFAADPKRFDTFSFQQENIIADFSKQKITPEILDSLLSLLQQSGFAEKQQAMFEGNLINDTEGRAVLHTALRRPKSDTVLIDAINVMPVIHQVLEKLEAISTNMRNGTYKGATGKPIRHIISIGIGGSDLGPRLISHAFSLLQKPEDVTLDLRFVANIDGNDFKNAVKDINAEETVFVVISKSFKTQETLVNALSAKDWLLHALPQDSAINKHFFAVSSNVDAAKKFGIDEESIFPMWDWVNGRFSLWSAVGLPLCLAYGFDAFKNLLDGAHAMDQHFLKADPAQNLPVLMALCGIWNRNFLGHEALAVLPYAEPLKFLPAYLQQLEMESNGKTVDKNGIAINDYTTCPIIFGEVGTNGQHSFYQLLHQGTSAIGFDFIGIIQDISGYAHHHRLLLSHMLAQGQAFLQGRQQPDKPFRYFSGNKPSTTLLLERLTPYSLGQLIALYEHKTFTQGIIWNINSFDQFGVELGKELAHNLEHGDIGMADSSTQNLFSLVHKYTK